MSSLLQGIPQEIEVGIVGNIPFAFDQTQYVIPRAPEAGNLRIYRILAELNQTNFFLNKDIVKYLFKHKAYNRESSEPLHRPSRQFDGSDNINKLTSTQLIMLAPDQTTKSTLKKAEEKRLVRYRISTCYQSRQARRGNKPSHRRKAQRRIPRTNKDTYTELLARTTDNRTHRALERARDEDEEVRMQNGGELPLLEGLCIDILTQPHGWQDTGRGCFRYDIFVGYYRIGDLPVCSGCHMLHLQITYDATLTGKIKSLLAFLHLTLDIVIRKVEAANVPVSPLLPRTWTGLNYAGPDGYLQPAAVELLVKIFYGRNATLNDCRDFLPAASIAAATRRFNMIVGAMIEAHLQAVQTYNPRDLDAYGLPFKFIRSVAVNYGLRVDTLNFTREVTDYFIARFAQSTGPIDDVQRPKLMVAGFWNKRIAQDYNIYCK
jgi:hypothetical protein